MKQKWQKRRGFLKIHVAVDVKSKQITGLEITDDKFHDSKSFTLFNLREFHEFP